MLQIKNTLGGGKPEGLYVWKKNEIGSELKVLNKSVSTLPYNFRNGRAVVLNGEIHILGSSDSNSTQQYHYKFDGSSWISVSTLPYYFYGGDAVVLNNEIHILGSSRNGYRRYHYKWDGSSWTSVSTLPYDLYGSEVVVLNGEIHILGSDDSNCDKLHYKWDGSSWTSVSTLPYSFCYASAVVLNNEIHILGSYNSSSYTKHYKFDGSSWTSVSTLPYNFYQGSAVVLDNEIYILGGRDNATEHYKWDGNSWTSVSTLPYNFVYGSAVVYNNGIHILGSENSSYYTAHYLIIGYVPVYTLLDYIVSDKETAYPDGGEKGGYWYERVVEGAKVAYGSVNPTGDLTKLVINHGLGKEPTLIIGYCESNISNVFNHDFIVEGVTAKIKYNDSIYTRTATNVDVNTMEIPNTTVNWGGYNYRWIAIAE